MNRKITEKKIKQVIKKIVREFKPEKIILFGSWAWGNPTPDSDVDLFLVKETKNTRELAREIDSSIFPRLFPLDLIVYRPQEVKEREKQGDFFIQNILNNGKVLYGE